MYLVTNAEMRRLDRYTIEEVGIPAAVLMENAGAGVAKWAEELTAPGARIVVAAGKGNNGGDGLVAARHLSGRGRKVEVLLAAGPDELRGEAALQLQALRHWPVRVYVDDGATDWSFLLRGADLVVDALLGTGLTRPVESTHRRLIECINGSGAPVLAVDLPSGLDGDGGRVMGEAVRAGWTLCLGLPKRGLVTGEGPRYAGIWRVHDIGLAPRGPEVLGIDRVRLLEAADIRNWWPRRPFDSHKGLFGHLLVIAGAPQMWGAALLCGTAAYRSGAGLVTVAVSGEAVPPWLGAHPELMTAFWRKPEEVLSLLDGKDALVVGPGLARFSGDVPWLKQVLSRVGAAVVDAGALDVWREAAADGWRPPASVVLTPHPKEMARLTGLSTREVQSDRLETARRVAQRYGCTVVLKGAYSVIAAPDGRAFVNPTGNPGMATGGTGDVLAGVIGSLLAQGLPPVEAAAAGVYIHGAAGDRAAEKTGMTALTAGDVVEGLGAAIRQLVE
ncbi:MAG: NAD(P)H-hydrate dehydratase [Alicyclobacillaceae bacterium]|nr:NAD(P)H-hydrate dehydratase [Alicyclobacillaceae bacterium]